ncbi:glyoxalase [Cohnella endophytica]|uniref:Glyoxalase n=1 Tax=Cohnella endophytica TaxID=2419778 RepID=A0A494XIQ8_9BACL|nr:glyoxalase [Cohnella endophytica]RKP48009.1 glyoxalase [Cohnella endophytica]
MAVEFLGIDHVQLAAYAGCETEARKFYGELLGWPEIPKPETLAGRGGVWFQCGAHQVHIGVQADFAPATKAHPAFSVRSIDLLREHFFRHNIGVVNDRLREAEDVKRFYADDPFGNRLEFLEWGTVR